MARKQTRPRYEAVKAADAYDDQKSAVEIAAAHATATTQEELQEFVLSQIKRILHGDLAGRWFDDPTTIASLAALRALVVGARWNVELLGTKDGVNRTFTTPEKFLHSTYADAEPRLRLYHNGRRLIEGDDFLPSESGGAGTGFDTVTMLSLVPNGRSRLTADYTRQP